MTVSYEALDYRFTVRAPAGVAMAEVHELLAGFAVDADLAGLDEVELADPRFAPAAASALVGTINLRAIGCAAGSLLLHAGGAARDDGRVTILVGSSGSGKSTLTTELVLRGRHYLTDETLCLAADSLRITPFRKPVSLKPGSYPLFPQLRPSQGSLGALDSDRQWLVSPKSLEGGVADVPSLFVPGLLIFPTFEEGADTRAERLSPGQAAYQLGVNTSSLTSVSGRPLAVLASLARRVPAFRLIHNDLAAAADLIAELEQEAG